MRILPVTVPAIAVAAVAAAALSGTLAGIVLAVVGGTALGIALHLRRERRAHRLAERVRAGIGGAGASPPPDLPAWDDLEAAVETMIAAHERRRDRLAQARDLRIELVEALHVPAVLFDRDGALVRANAASRQRLGVADQANTPIQAVANANLAGAVEEAIETGRPVELETTRDDRHLVVMAAPVGDEVVLIVTDETERRRVADVRRDFVANASHELKTPVAGIQALADALRATLDRDLDRSRSLVERLGEEAERLAKLVHELLNLRRLEEGDEFATVAVDLADVVRSEARRLGSRAARREVGLHLDVPDEALIDGVEQDLHLVVANLLDNAIVYNQRGGRVDVVLTRGGTTWRLTVTDTGLGIPRGDLDRVFERFYRVDVARSRATGGTGLGLSIVRHAVERHGGSVAVDSVLGEGTTFTVELPVGSSS